MWMYKDSVLMSAAIEALKEEMRKIRIAMGLESESSPEDVLATKKRGSDEQQGLDLNNPCSDQWSNIPTHEHHNKEQICGSLLIDPSPSMEVNLTVGENQEPVSYKMKPLTQCIWKNNRRSWTPELHARFAVVLHLLGGPEGCFYFFFILVYSYHESSINYGFSLFKALI